jgi:hypothetical protein
MPPALTPWQVSTYLDRRLQTEYLGWIDDWGHLFGLASRQEWKLIGERELIPAMPGYELASIEDNYESRQIWQEFIASAVKNPKYLPCMGVISEEDQ